MNKKRAFTLVELIITLSIIVILLSVVRVNLVQSKKSLAIQELSIISESITNARTYSISSESEIKIFSSIKENSIEIKSKDYYFKTIRCKYLNVDNNLKFTFNKNGVPDSGESFDFSYGDIKYRISIRPTTGYVSVVEER